MQTGALPHSLQSLRKRRKGALQIRSEVARHVRGTVRGRVRGLRRGISTGDASESVQVGNRPAHLQCLGRLQGRRVLSWGACWCRRGTSWGRFEGLNSIPVCIRALDMDHLNQPMHSYSQPLPVFSFQACTGARCSHGCRALMRRLRLTTFRATCHASGIWRCCRSTLTAVVCEGGPETVHRHLPCFWNLALLPQHTHGGCLRGRSRDGTSS